MSNDLVSPTPSVTRGEPGLVSQGEPGLVSQGEPGLVSSRVSLRDGDNEQ